MKRTRHSCSALTLPALRPCPSHRLPLISVRLRGHPVRHSAPPDRYRCNAHALCGDVLLSDMWRQDSGDTNAWEGVSERQRVIRPDRSTA